MELTEFLVQMQNEIRTEIEDRLRNPGKNYPYPETVFSEIVMQHMADHGMTFEPEVYHHSAKVRGAELRLSGIALSDEADQLDLFVSLYEGAMTVSQISAEEVKKAAEQCLRFLTHCASGTLAADESHEVYSLATTIHRVYSSLDQIRIYVLTDRQVGLKSKRLKDREINGKTIKLEVMDIERLHRHLSEGKPRDELVINFEEVSGSALPCVYVPGEMDGYDYALTVFPGEALRFIYEKYGSRLLEANVRSFLSATGKVNRGIRDTLREDPERFMAYNNGIVVVADEAYLGTTKEGGPGLLWLKGMQIVNGGQTTASIYFSKKKSPEIDLRRVRIPAKVIVLRSQDPAAEEALIADISKYANSQNSVKQSDLSANKPFHVEIEKLSLSTYCPDGIGRWFYERAAGSYNTMLSRDASTPAALKRLKEVVTPPSRKVSKTDLAKYLNAWDRKPDVVSLGSQKNFEAFMDAIKDAESKGQALPDVAAYKTMIAKAILFKKATSLVRPMFPAFQGNVAVYLISILSDKVGERFDFDKVWARQDISDGLRNQLRTWAMEVHAVLQKSSNGRMISEWAKKPECWSAVRAADFSPVAEGIPELR